MPPRAPLTLAWGGLVALLVGCGGGATEVPSLVLPDGRTRGSVDFALDVDVLEASLLVIDRTFATSSCSVLEGAISAPGRRRLVVFETLIANLGELDCVIGDPAAPVPPLDPADFELAACHGHRHMHGYAAYELRRLDGSVAAVGHKQGFCLLDTEVVHPAAGARLYDCAFQGLSSGWGDRYTRSVDGQWVDVTGLPAGDYLLAVRINAEGVLPEAVDLQPNAALVPVTLPDPDVPFDLDDDHADSGSQATPLPHPIALEATLESVGDADWFRVLVTAGRRYVLSVELLTLPDSALRVTTVGGATLATNDDAGPGDRSSRIVLLAPFSGPVLLEVTGPGAATGTYRIVTEDAP